MVLATGLPFEVVAGFTKMQFIAMQQAVKRYWERMAAVNGLQAMFGGSKRSSGDMTDAFEAKVKAMKKATGKDKLDLSEVV